MDQRIGISHKNLIVNYAVKERQRCVNNRFFRQHNLQAVQGNPPNMATGLVGAVGQIHLICYVNFQKIYYKRISRNNIFPNIT